MTSMTRETARALVAPFYAALNAPGTKDVAALVASVASPEWRSYGSANTSKGREEFIKQVMGFGKLIPDLAWEVKEVLVDGDTIVVRSEASGTPAADFMGVPHGGGRFSVVAIDMHKVGGGKLVRADHVEDWATAIRQLSARA
jgi:predicted ester cyclase